MIQQMKRRFLIVSMGSFLIVMLVLFVVLNTLNYIQNVRREEWQAIEFVEMQLELSDETLPDENIQQDSQIQGYKPKIKNNTFNFEELFSNQLDKGLRPIRHLTNYFYVLYDEQGNITETQIGSTETISQEEAQSLAMEIYQQHQKSGWSGYYRFINHELSDKQTVVIYVNAFRMIESTLQFIGLSTLIFITILIVVYLLLRFFSKRAIMPIVKNIERQKEFISNASHEIKTPLAVLSTNNDVMEMLGMESEWTKSNRHQIKRLNGLVEQMLILARFDEGKATLNKVELNLTEMVQTLLDDVSVLTKEKQLNIINHLPEGINVIADEASLRQLLMTLIENAIKYHVGDDVIEVYWHGNKQTLSIENSCEAMTEDERKQLFERFYRRDTARNREQGGSGMGLSIAKAVAQASDLQLDATLKTPTRIIFNIGFGHK